MARGRARAKPKTKAEKAAEPVVIPEAPKPPPDADLVGRIDHIGGGQWLRTFHHPHDDGTWQVHTEDHPGPPYAIEPPPWYGGCNARDKGACQIRKACATFVTVQRGRYAQRPAAR